jgi:hypothetical protein
MLGVWQKVEAQLVSNQLCLLHLVQDGAGELVSGRVASHVTCSCNTVIGLARISERDSIFNLPISDNLVDRLRDAVGVVIKTNVSQHHGSGQNQGGRVGLVLALDVETDVTASRLEQGNVTAHIASRDNTGATDKTSTDVREDTSVQVGHNHDVELLWPGDTLHRGVVDNHVVGLESGVVLADALDSVAKKTIGKLHDIGLVDAGNLLAVVGEGKGESELGNALRLLPGDDLERLDDAVDRLVLEARVLSLGVLTDDAEVDVLVARLVAGDVLEEDNGGIDVEFLTESDVEGAVTRALDGRVKDTLETELVALERGNGFAEELLGVHIARLDTGNVDLLPLDGHVVRLEDLLDRLSDLGTDTVTCALFNICIQQRRLMKRLSRRTRNQSHSVFAAELCGLEDVLADRGHCCSVLDRVYACDAASILHRETMDGPHRAGFAPRRRVWRGRISKADSCGTRPIGGAWRASYLRRSLRGPRQHGDRRWRCVELVVRDLEAEKQAELPTPKKQPGESARLANDRIRPDVFPPRPMHYLHTHTAADLFSVSALACTYLLMLHSSSGHVLILEQWTASRLPHFDM